MHQCVKFHCGAILWYAILPHCFPFLSICFLLPLLAAGCRPTARSGTNAPTADKVRRSEHPGLTFCQKASSTRIAWKPIKSNSDGNPVEALLRSNMAGVEHSFHGTWEVCMPSSFPAPPLPLPAPADNHLSRLLCVLFIDSLMHFWRSKGNIRFGRVSVSHV